MQPAEPLDQRPLTDADRAARVVRVGALCRLGAARPGVHSFMVGEFVELDTGRLVLLHERAGVTVSAVRGAAVGLVDRMTADDVVSAVLAATLPDADDGRAHDWDLLTGLARARGLAVRAEHLAELPYDVVLGGDVVDWLRSTRSTDTR